MQDQVTTSLELLRNAGIKIWMLTGDKLETAICIAKSSGLFSKTDNVHIFGQVQSRIDAHNELNALRRSLLAIIDEWLKGKPLFVSFLRSFIGHLQNKRCGISSFWICFKCVFAVL